VLDLSFIDLQHLHSGRGQQR